MEDTQHFLQISETRWDYSSTGFSEQTEPFLQQFFDNYIKYSDNLFASFFTGKDIEVQQRILKHNFGLEKEQIETWENRATRCKMTSESFALFLHIAMYSAKDAYRRRKIVEDVRREFESREQNKRNKSKSKKPKKDKKKKKKIHVTDSEDSSVQKWQDEFDELTRNSDDDDIVFDDDRENIRNRPITKDMDLDSNIDQPIAVPSGSKSSIVDQSLLHIIPDKEIVPPIIITPKPQQEKLSEEIIPLTKSSNKKKKSKTNSVQNVITGYEPTDDGTSNIRDILVYDIPASWTPEDILKQLTLWGKTISIQTKQQRKYQTLRLKIELSTFRLAQFEVNENPVWTTDLGGIPVRWFPARWTLKERKEREKFQATIREIPDSMTLATLWTNQHPHSFLTAIKGLKSFKIIQTAKKERKLIGYFEKWVDMRAALDNQFVWENQQLSWNRHAPPTQRTRSQGSNTDKNRRTSGSRKTEKTQQDSKNSKKKPQETKSVKPKKQKKDKSRKESRSKVLAEILDLLRKIV